MKEPSPTISPLKTSKRKPNNRDLEDPNPKPSKRLKTLAVAPIHEPEEVSSKTEYISSSMLCDYIASRAISNEKEIVGKDKDPANENPATATHQHEEWTTNVLSNKDYCKVAREIVKNVEYPKNESPYRPDRSATITSDDLLRRGKLLLGILSQYNNTNSTKYELVEDETINSCLFAESSGRWIHCCFYAVDSSIKQPNAEDSSIKLQFFAEVKFSCFWEPTVTYCMIIEGETRVGCKKCISVTHPVVGAYHGNSTDASHAVSNIEGCEVDREIVENEADPMTDLFPQWTGAAGYPPPDSRIRPPYIPTSPNYEPTIPRFQPRTTMLLLTELE